MPSPTGNPTRTAVTSRQPEPMDRLAVLERAAPDEHSTDRLTVLNARTARSKDRPEV